MREDIAFFRKYNCLPMPKIIQMEITNSCPLFCPQCYKSLQPNELEFNEFCRRIDLYSVYGIKSIMINGGEPLCHPSFLDMLRYIDKHEMTTNCFLSGYGIDKLVIQNLENLHIVISISLNGSTEKINSLSRDGYYYSLNALKILSDSNIRYGINWVARADNVDDFKNVIILAKQYGCHFINIIGNKISGNSLQSPMQRQDFETLSHTISDNNTGIPIQIESCFSMLSAYMNRRTPALYTGCMAGRLACFVDIQGRYMPCSHLYYPEDFSSLSDYWKMSTILQKLRAIDPKKISYCNNCERNSLCRVCRAYSSQLHDNFTKGAEGCIIYRRNDQ